MWDKGDAKMGGKWCLYDVGMFGRKTIGLKLVWNTQISVTCVAGVH